MKIIIETIPHAAQRYPTVGDWFYQGDELHIKVSNLSDERYCALVAIHELVEVLLCRQRGISQETVDRFDILFEQQREEGIHNKTDEPGDSAWAPYQFEHGMATGVERIMAAQLGVNWSDYEKEVESL